MTIPSLFRRPLCAALGLALALACLTVLADGAEPTKKFSNADIAFYEKQVLPILKDNCFKCHADKKSRGGLKLDSRSALIRGGDQGPAVVFDKLDDSLFLKAIHYKGDLKMPPAGQLGQDKIAILHRWLQMGAPYPPGKTEDDHKGEPTTLTVTDADRAYWAYRPLVRPAVPRVQNPAWARTPIDHFIQARLEANGLTPAAPAERIALIRRVYYDLTGLPPTPEEIDAFVADTRPDAYVRLVDRLLASPAYGERWGRHWLDLVRFAETHGYERDSLKPFAWRYRDWVIAALNADMPYSRFLLEQLAGDELDEVTAETLTATGFYRLGLWDDEPADRLLAKYDVLDGVVSTTGQVVLGMTVGCARCHDHKKDPVPQKDYYRLLAFFQNVTDMNRTNTRIVQTGAELKRLQREAADRQRHEGELYRDMYALEQKLIAGLSKKGIAVDQVGADLSELRYRFYRDTWTQLPDFDSLKHEESGEVASNLVGLSPASRPEAMGLVFEGKLKVPAQGEYTFELSASEGARLIVNGKTVIDRPERGKHQASGKQTLSPGLVPFRLEHFNTTSRPALSLAWSGPGVTRRLLSEGGKVGQPLVSDSRNEGITWRYTTTPPGKGWMMPKYDDKEWAQGPGGFGTKGTPGAVVRTTWNTKSIFLRRTFEVSAIPSSLSLDVHHDEDVKVFLNGKPIYSASGFLKNYARYALDEEARSALRVGTNVLAVTCKQTTGGQYVDVGLSADGSMAATDLMKQHGEAILGARDVTRYAELAAELQRNRKAVPSKVGQEVMCVAERGRAPTHLLIRGNPHAKGAALQPGLPEVLTRGEVKLPNYETKESSGRRRALAEWLTSDQNGLTARVMANRLWQHHFGRGIVPTPSDFGKLGEAPTHPELLEYLADELIRSGWHLKPLHRQILLSSAYQMSSSGNKQGLTKDPANNLFWRFNMRRLAAEEVRDSMLAVTGELNRKMTGPGVYPTIPRAVLAGQSRPGDGWGYSSPSERARRSVYVHVKRSLIVPILEAHDLADTDNSCAVRFTTTVPTQSLGMLNGEFSGEQAATLAARLESEVPDDAGRVHRAIRLTTGRVPTAEEVRRDVAFLAEMRRAEKLDAQQALRMYCLMMLNANEFVYLD